MSMLLAGTLATGGRLTDGWVEVDGGSIGALGDGDAPRKPDERLEGILAPGLRDLQVNGAGGYEVTGGAAALDAIDAVQLAHGVTAYLPTLISPEDATAERVLAELAERAADPASPVAGAHVEGPFLSPEHAGMHPAERLRSPADGVPAWLESPVVRMVTLAPELPGALDLIRRLSGRGIAVAIGHSGADADTTRAAVDAGASIVTHLFNAMVPLRHHAPGLPGVALLDERLRVGVIPDGVHVDPLIMKLVWRAARGRVFLITDATPATCAPPGRYEMAGVTVEAAPGEPARAPDGRLAGSALTLDEAVRNWAAMAGATMAEAIAAGSEVPARAAGLAPASTPGAPADFVLLDEDGNVLRVMSRGRWVG